MTTSRLETAAVGYPVTRFGVSFFPVYLTGNELPEIAAEGLVIDELEQATVPELVAQNPTDKPILIVEGEQLIGGKQNRVINTTVLAPPMSRLHIPVSCIEQGRWGRARAYRKGACRTPSSVRARLQESLNAPAQGEAPRQGDQGAVWEEVDSVLHRLGVQSATAAAADAEEVFRRNRTRTRSIEKLAQLGPLPRQNGIVVSHGPWVKGVELFGSPGLLAAHWSTLVRSYLLEVPGEEGALGRPAVWLHARKDLQGGWTGHGTARHGRAHGRSGIDAGRDHRACQRIHQKLTDGRPRSSGRRRITAPTDHDRPRRRPPLPHAAGSSGPWSWASLEALTGNRDSGGS